MKTKHILSFLLLAILLVTAALPAYAQESTPEPTEEVGYTSQDLWYAMRYAEVPDYELAEEILEYLMENDPQFGGTPSKWIMTALQYAQQDWVSYYQWLAAAQAEDTRRIWSDIHSSAVLYAYMEWILGNYQPGIDLDPSSLYGWEELGAYAVKSLALLGVHGTIDADLETETIFATQMLTYARFLPEGVMKDMAYWYLSMFTRNSAQCQRAIEVTTEWETISSGVTELGGPYPYRYWQDLAVNDCGE